MSVDLHLHTTYSDGTMSPEELVIHACRNNLTAIAITDHDITDGNKEAVFYGEKYGINVVPGVELSIDHTLPNNGHMHILGLFIDSNNIELSSTLENLRNERNIRNIKILKILEGLNIPISMEELLFESGGGSVGRPHIAKLMLKHKYVLNLQEAFDSYLKKGAPAYIDKVKLNFEKVIKLVKNAGGIAILAHPCSLGFENYDEIAMKILELKELGLDGIEVFYSLHSVPFTSWIRDFAQKCNFIISGGADFHGKNKPDIKIGLGKGNLNIPDIVYHRIVSYYKNVKNK